MGNRQAKYSFETVPLVAGDVPPVVIHLFRYSRNQRVDQRHLLFWVHSLGQLGGPNDVCKQDSG